VSLIERARHACIELGHNPNKLRGQNFCIEPGVLQLMIKTADLTPKETVLEIGPGFGFLTEELLKSSHKVLAIEVEEFFIKTLHRLSNQKKLQLIHADVLKLPLEKYLTNNYSVVSNLPYSITGAIIKRLLTIKPAPRKITILLQKEVAERMVAKPGKMNLLALATQLYSEPHFVRRVGAQSFWPAPKVDSAIITLNKIGLQKKLNSAEEKFFWQLAKFGFASKRKQLHNNLAAGLRLNSAIIKDIFQQISLDEKIRSQDLDIDQWLCLTRQIVKVTNPLTKKHK
jgi:16S rRNA (adenine1518-N6/adenine1519-N6)-dimethyltransferase